MFNNRFYSTISKARYFITALFILALLATQVGTASAAPLAWPPVPWLPSPADYPTNGTPSAGFYKAPTNMMPTRWTEFPAAPPQGTQTNCVRDASYSWNVCTYSGGNFVGVANPSAQVGAYLSELYYGSILTYGTLDGNKSNVTYVSYPYIVVSDGAHAMIILRIYQYDGSIKHKYAWLF